MITLPPFKAFLASNIPSVYDNTLSYYDELTKLLAYLEQVIVPAINEMQGDVEIVKAGIKELKEYVDHYFDNLDVQTEINNKLDAMAASGQLTQIIAQYLSLGAVLGYASVADMSAAENLISGSICRVLATNSDYKVRPITNDDIVDGYFIVALHDDSLVAERIDTGIFAQKYYLGAFHKKYSESDKRDYLFLSSDAINWTKIPNIEIHGQSSSGGGDPSIVYDAETGYFLIAYSNQDTGECFTVMRSKNLTTWTEHTISLTLPPSIQGYAKWAPDFFRGADGKLYVIFAAEKTADAYDFEGLITECTDVENLTFSNPYIINIDVQHQEYDFSIRYFNNKYYMVASDFGKINLFTSTDLENFSLVKSNLFGVISDNNGGAVEGCNLAVIGDKLMVYAEYPNIERYCAAEIDTSNNTLSGVTLLNSLQGYKHGSVMTLNDNHAIAVTNRVAENIVDNNMVVNTNVARIYIALTQDTTISEYTIMPDQLLIITGNGHTLTISNVKDPYNLRKMDFILYDAIGTLNITAYEGDSTYSSYSYTAQPGTGKKKKTIDFSFNALDNAYDYLVAGISGNVDTTMTGASGKIYYKQFGKIVYIEVDITSTGDYGYNETLGSLPEAIRPSTRSALSIGRNVANDSTCFLAANPEGTVTIINGAAGRVIGNITYMI